MLMTEGTAVVFVLAYEIHSDARLPLSIDCSGLPGVLVRVYAPFVSHRIHRASDPLDLRLVPHLAGTRPPVEALPQVQITGTTTWPGPAVIANALRLDLYGIPDSERDGYASAFLERFTQWVRWACRQWWVGNGPSESIFPLALSFPVDALGQGKGTVAADVSVMPWTRGECLLSEPLFRTCAQLAANGTVLPLPARLLLDGIEAYMRQAYHKSALLLAQSVESVIETVVTEARKDGEIDRRVARHVLKLDIEDRLDRGLMASVGRSYRADHDEGCDTLRGLWVLRHAVAHADMSQLTQRCDEFTRERLYRSARAASDLFEWLARTRRVSAGHWLAACLRPIFVDDVA